MPKVKIREDKYGIFVCSDGYVARPPTGIHTKFKKGDVVRANHPAGPITYVKPEWDTNRKANNPNLEVWNIIQECSSYRKEGPEDPLKKDKKEVEMENRITIRKFFRAVFSWMKKCRPTIWIKSDPRNRIIIIFGTKASVEKEKKLLYRRRNETKR